MRLDSENREKAEIAEENEHRLAEKLKQKNEKEIERNLRMSIVNASELGECEIIELLNPLIGKGEKKRIYKFIQHKFLRPSFHKMASEYSAWDQVLNILLLNNFIYNFRLIKFL